MLSKRKSQTTEETGNRKDHCAPGDESTSSTDEPSFYF